MKKLSLTIAVSSIFMLTTALKAQDRTDIQPTIATSITYATEDITEANSSAPSSSEPAEHIKSIDFTTSRPVSSETTFSTKPTAQPESFQTQAISGAMKEHAPLATTVNTRSVRSTETGVVHSLISIVENGARGTSYDPLNPYKLERYETQIIYEYFPRPEVSIGAIPTFMKSHFAFQLSPDTDHVNSGGIISFANYLFTPNWLGTIQGGYYYDTHNWLYPQFSGDPPNVSLRQQAHRFYGALYATWIGPRKCISGSIRAGALYEYEHVKSAVDSVRVFQRGHNFERGSVTLSGRLKYTPAYKWELYFQTQIDYSLKLTRRDGDFKAGGGRQSLRFLVGPGVHYNISPTSELSFTYFNIQGYGYYRENQVSVRFRVLL